MTIEIADWPLQKMVIFRGQIIPQGHPPGTAHAQGARAKDGGGGQCTEAPCGRTEPSRPWHFDDLRMGFWMIFGWDFCWFLMGFWMILDEILDDFDGIFEDFRLDFWWFSDEMFVDFWWDFWGSSTGFWMILDEILDDFWWDFWGFSIGFLMIFGWDFCGFLMGFLRIFHGILDDSQWDFQFFAMLRWIFGSCSQCREEVEPLVRQPGGELIVQEISRDDPFMWYCTTTTVIFEVQNGYSMPRIVDNTYL